MIQKPLSYLTEHKVSLESNYHSVSKRKYSFNWDPLWPFTFTY